MWHARGGGGVLGTHSTPPCKGASGAPVLVVNVEGGAGVLRGVVLAVLDAQAKLLLHDVPQPPRPQLAADGVPRHERRVQRGVPHMRARHLTLKRQDLHVHMRRL